MLKNADEVEVVGEAGDGCEAIEQVKKLNPDVVLMDLAMPKLNGIEAARQIHRTHPNVRIIMVSVYTDRQYIFESFRAGVVGYVPKDVAFAELLDAIRSVMAGSTFLSQPLTKIVMDDYFRRAKNDQPGSDLEKLSGREREVLQLIAQGKSSMQIAAALHISVRTVNTHRYHIMEKLDVNSMADLTKFAIRHGLCTL